MSIIVRFDLVYRLHDNSHVRLLQRKMPQVPSEGQIVSIDGDPYRVIHVGWAVPRWDDTDPVGPREDQDIYAFVRVQKASDFTVTIGGVEY